ncbi:Hypothetical protein precursor [gamma proteobacterium HdN1]|nr:Hypothetical protein precursor [gamma proteobacterium HdN1]
MKSSRLFAMVAGVSVSALLSAGLAYAHSNEYLATITGPHGGMVRMVGPSHFELVVTPAALQVYVTDHGDNARSVEGATGSVMMLSGKSKQQIELQPKGGNLMEGAGSFSADQTFKAVVKIHLAGQQVGQVMFDSSAKVSLQEGAAMSGADHHHGSH